MLLVLQPRRGEGVAPYSDMLLTDATTMVTCATKVVFDAGGAESTCRGLGGKSPHYGYAARVAPS